ncbi:hypothetical protein [Amycolatopsis keratiniphila]|uniref:Uncharacterized protein n=1 Tax=Amycolatopsis keratiniphila subsp. keratiniphila TaxID=227715 RepID=A0A1W2M2U9_9PSEU|nr:hypothetical protein [Amycolatopsis keratiniphila]ONF74366.1 hypothetical protein AVR91_0203495 [Amycolatopsis keratiniphila subsp. keratiniphila]
MRQWPRVWRLVRVPLAAGGVVLALGLYLLAGTDNRLEPAVYQQLRIGQSQEDVENVCSAIPHRRRVHPPPTAATAG